MAEAGSLQDMWERLGPEGFMVITALDGNDTADLKDWADTYGATHPIVGDGDGTFFWTYSKYSAWPMRVLIDHGMVLTSIDDGADEPEVQALLDQYQ
jgi:Ca2+-binding RTX toxin-like protein